MNTLTVKSDSEIKEDVLAELKYEPSVRVTDIGVLVKAGVVTLNGYDFFSIRLRIKVMAG